MEEWKVHFMRLLGRVKRKVRRREKEREKGGREEEEELNMEKVKKAIRMLKDGKVAGIDELPSEAYKLNKIWGRRDGGGMGVL